MTSAVVAGPRSSFDSPEDYIAFMQDPQRVLRLEWRKARRPESRGLTSHSWLEAQLADGKRWRLEIYADVGYAEAMYDPQSLAARRAEEDPRFRDPRFFDPQSQLYEGRAAESNDFAEPLAADALRSLARGVAAERPYRVSEFNCHHFVLDVWNKVVIDALRVVHYPDRAKTGLLWGFEGGFGTWLEGIGKSLGAPAQTLQEAAAGTNAGAACGSDDLCLRSFGSSGELQLGPRIATSAALAAGAAGPSDAELEALLRTLRAGRLHVREARSGRGLPPRFWPAPAEGASARAAFEAWSRGCLSGVNPALAARLAAGIAALEAEVDELVARIFQPQAPSAGAAPSKLSAGGYGGYSTGGGGGVAESLSALTASFGSFASTSAPHAPVEAPLGSAFASLGSLSSMSAAEPPALLARAPPLADRCFVVLLGQTTLRLATYAVLRQHTSGAMGCAWRLRLLQGDVRTGQEANVEYSLGDLPEGSPTTLAADLLWEDFQEGHSSQIQAI